MWNVRWRADHLPGSGHGSAYLISLTSPDRPIADRFALILYLLSAVTLVLSDEKTRRTGLQRVHNVLSDTQQLDSLHKACADMTWAFFDRFGALEKRPLKIVGRRVGNGHAGPA